MVVHVIDFSTVSRHNKLNPLGLALRQYILSELAQAQADPSCQSIIVTGGTHFSAGADLTEFAQFGQQQDNNNDTLIHVVNALENSNKPVVACIAGHCLGGGLEVALACHYRVAAAGAKLGLPEVQVGVIPGAGGTQRLPRLIGLPLACQMILTGQPVSGRKALQLGLVDAIVDDPSQALEKAHQWAEWAQVMPIRRVGQMPLKESPAEAHVILHTASLSLPRHYPGPLAAIRALRAAYTEPTFQQGMEVEGEEFLNVLLSPQGQAQRHAFFAVRAAQKVRMPVANKQHALLHNPTNTHVAVIGAGTMGSGIAMVLLRAGFCVHLVDNHEPALRKGMTFLHSTLESQQKRGKLSPTQVTQLKERLHATQDMQELSSCQLVVEAVIENMGVKQAIFQKLNQVTPPTAILLSNTSTLDIDQMAAVLDPHRRAKFAGWHFFSPAHVMKLVEIVVGRDANPETVALLQALTKRIGKIGVVVGNCDGFCGNRLLKPYSLESILLLVEGHNSIDQVDQAFVDFGMMLGPFQMGDLAGNDVAYNIRRERGWVREDNNTPPNRPPRYTELPDDMVAKLGRLGQKVGMGFYDYDPTIGKGRKGLPSTEMGNLIESYRLPDAQPTEPDEMIQRVLFPLVNEGFKCLEEGIAQTPGDIDVIYLFGYGWPAWRGGPMYWADHDVTLPVLLKTLQRLHDQFPTTEHFVPSRLLERCVALDMTVEEYYRTGMASNEQRSRL